MLEAGRVAGFFFAERSSSHFATSLMDRLTLLAFLAAAAAGATGCDLNTFRRTPIDHAGFAKELDVDTTAMTLTPSGLRYVDVKAGEGPAAGAGSFVAVQYTGWLVNGHRFDSSAGRGPYQFRIGNHEVIEGWDEGLTGMKVGGKRKLVIPASLGYGAEGSPPDIPPNATLVFDVELVGLR